MISRTRKFRLALVVFVSVALAVPAVLIVLTLQDDPVKGTPSVILMIGDGMGTGQLAAARYSNVPHLVLAMDHLRWEGLVSTHSADDLVTDSAAAATALATGYKTNNGVVGVDPNGIVLETVLERAESLGLSTGLVTTTRITHATPAALAAHVSSRGLEDEIANQVLQADIEILMGGGRRHFLPTLDPQGARQDDRNLIEDARQQGYTVVSSASNLLSWDAASPLLALFHEGHMSYDESRNGSLEPSLVSMTKAALGALKKDPGGFFIMIEGGRIDHASHANDLDTTISEVLAFDAAVQVALDFTRMNENVLLVVTADHETGGLGVTPSDVMGNPHVLWSTTSHTSDLVPLFSEGVFSQRFQGLLDNTDVGARLLELLARQVRGKLPWQGISSIGELVGTASLMVATLKFQTLALRHVRS